MTLQRARQRRPYPKHKVCDSCGRNQHKVAVYYPRRLDLLSETIIPAHTRGYCPSCYTEATIESAAEGNAELVYDRRARKPELEKGTA